MQIMSEFLVFGPVSAGELIARSGLTPTTSWSKGDPIGKTRRQRPESCIALATPIQDLLDFAPQLEEILPALRPHAARIAALVQSGCTTQLSLVIYQSRGGDTVPAINITPPQLQFLAELSCTLDVDIV